MGSIRRRLGQLESRTSARTEGRPDYLEAYFRELESFRLVDAGLDPLPYSALDRSEDESFLEETLPAYKDSPGWRTGEAREVLDAMEEQVRQRLERNER